MFVLNFRSVGATVQPAERKQSDRQTHRQMDATENVASASNIGGKTGSYIRNEPRYLVLSKKKLYFTLLFDPYLFTFW